MIQELIDAISLAISQEFTGHKVYTHRVEQNLVTPCFSIRLLHPSNEREMNNRYKRSNRVAIQYIPSSNRDEYGEVIERLFICLQNIKSLKNTTFEASNMNVETQSDQVLTFLVNYNYYVYVKEEIGEPMESIDINQTARS